MLPVSLTCELYLIARNKTIYAITSRRDEGTCVSYDDVSSFFCEIPWTQMQKYLNKLLRIITQSYI